MSLIFAIFVPARRRC